MQPSIYNGFYCRNGCPLPPLYPSLQRGLVASYAPLLGRQGSTLFDWSGYSRHGTLTNMDAGTDWVPSSFKGASGYALDFDGTDDYVDFLTTGDMNPDKITVSCSVNLSSTSGTRTFVSKFGDVVNVDSFVLRSQSGVAYFYVWINELGLRSASGSTLTQNKWHSVCGSYDGLAVRVYVDGKLAGTTAATGTIRSSISTMKLARPGLVLDSEKLAGKIANASVHNRACTEAEIRAMAADPLALYRFQLPLYETAVAAAGFNAAWARRRFAARYGVSLR